MGHHLFSLSIMFSDCVRFSICAVQQTQVVTTRGIKRLFPITVGKNPFLSKPPTISVVGSPVCAGQPNKGTDLGPQALRNTNLFEKLEQIGWKVKDDGDIEYDTFENDPPTKWGMKRSRLCGAANKALAEKMYPLLKAGHFCLNLGGDHSTAAGSLAAVLKARPETAVVWVDAHADINTDRTSPSGNIHGMPIALLLGMIDVRLIIIHHNYFIINKYSTLFSLMKHLVGNG